MRCGPGIGAIFDSRAASVDHALVIEIRARHVNQFAGLLLYGGDHMRMAMSRGSHGDAGREIEELVAVDIGHNDAAPALRHQRIGTGIRRRNIFLVALEHALALGPGRAVLILGPIAVMVLVVMIFLRELASDELRFSKSGLRS